MKLYGALVQMEVSGVRNLHGLKVSWKWQVFALFGTYKTQYRNFVSCRFLHSLESKQDPKLNPIIMKLKTYIDTNQFLKEP
ncbi:hypothetical protein MKX03_020818 [Papaver bracteatum]|nr:hypothetical protein MKX03_020818 [Papaver bracteatum]